MDQQAEHEKRIEAVVRIMAALYDKAAAYTNLVVIAGYAAFFAVWANIKGLLPKREMMYAALFMTISLICFVLWETAKMVMTTVQLNSLRRAESTRLAFVGAFDIRFIRSEMSARVTAGTLRWPRIGMMCRFP